VRSGIRLGVGVIGQPFVFFFCLLFTDVDVVGVCRFDMMNKRLYKTYVGLTNIIVRVSDGTEEGKAHSVLVNAHVDSTLPSPGAADDAMPVGIMMECIRVLVGTPTWEPKHAIVFRQSVHSIALLTSC
jgi:Zn-dependent M28 family amino/carboxypeptidase